jgi:hypothetical protein
VASPASPPARRPSLAWFLLPLGAALLYAGVRAVVGRRPTLDEMVPADAVLVWRFHDLAAYDAFRTPYDPDPLDGVGVAPAGESLGAEINLPGLPGVDRARPLVEVTLPPARHADARFWVLPVADEKALRKRFRDPDLPERHARRVDVHGAWAAAGSDFYAVKRAGDGPLRLPDDLGESWCVLVPDWPVFVDASLLPHVASAEPVAGVLKALGFDPSAAKTVEGPEGRSFEVPGGRVPIVRDAWARLVVRGWSDRLRADLVPAPGSEVAQALRDAAASPPAGGPAWAGPPSAEASIDVPGGAGRRALVKALASAGVPWPKAAAEGEWAALRLGAEGRLRAWTELVPGSSPAWALAMLAPPDALPDLAALGLPSPPTGTASPLPSPLSLTRPYGPVAGKDEVARRKMAPERGWKSGEELVVIGPDADAVATRVAALEAEPASPRVEPAGRVLLARFQLADGAARRLLGSALERGGILSPIAGGDVEGALSTDGTTLFLDAKRFRGGP